VAGAVRLERITLDRNRHRSSHGSRVYGGALWYTV